MQICFLIIRHIHRLRIHNFSGYRIFGIKFDKIEPDFIILFDMWKLTFQKFWEYLRHIFSQLLNFRIFRLFSLPFKQLLAPSVA